MNARVSHEILLCGLLAATGCGGGAEPAPSSGASPGDPVTTAEPLPDRLPVDELPTGDDPALVPPPGELQLTLRKAGLTTSLASLVPERSFDLASGHDAERTAVRTGVLVADLLLTVSESDDARLLSQLEQIRAGLRALGAAPELDRTLASLTDRVKAGAVRRDALVRELDELAQVALPRAGFPDAARTLPLIEAGSWLSGTHLVAQAALRGGDPAAANDLLKQPGVVRYFQRVTAAEQAEGAIPSVIAATLQGALSRLLAVAGKDGSLTEDDLAVVVATTHDVLVLL